MDRDKLNKWADLLLDTGKRNNLINFKDAKTGTVEVIAPDFASLFSKAEHSTVFEVYDPKLENDDEDEEWAQDDNGQEKRLSKAEYRETYARRLKRNGQVLIYNPFTNPMQALRNIGKKAKTAIEETGVNIAYMAFGFINWTEEESSGCFMRAPVLLVPISIENDSAIDPYYIKITDSDIIVNPTFCFKLKNDYGIELPEYEEEDVDEYLEKVEEKLSKLKWVVTRECKIATFSFLKINMHKDLKDNAAEILKNKDVRSLLGEESVPPATETQSLTDQPFYNVVDADSSQTEAIALARSGKSFVLQGPPGTGKSQTITNMIAECLASGKKILFVSEKLAALNVVYDKLKQAGLEEFCLELHSHKANKRDVINELCHTLKAQKSTVADNARRVLDEKSKAQTELDEYANELHKLRPTVNKTLYRLYEEVAACRKAPDVDFAIKEITSKGEDYIVKAENALERYVAYVPSVGYDYSQNVWYGYNENDCTYQAVAQLKADLQDGIVLCGNIQALNENLKSKYAICAENLCQAYALREFFGFCKTSEFITPALLAPATFAGVGHTISEMRALAEEILERKKILDENFDEDVYRLDGQTLYKKLTKEFGGWVARLFSGEYRQIVKQIKLCKKDGKKPNYQAAVSMMDVLRTYQQKQREFSGLEKKVEHKLGAGYRGVATDFAALQIEIENLTAIHSSGVTFGKLATMPYRGFSEKQAEFAEIADCFEKGFAPFERSEQRVAAKFERGFYDVRRAETGALLKKYRGCLDDIDNVDNWCGFVQLLNELAELEIKTFIDYAIKRNMPLENTIAAYKKAFYRQWIDAILHESPLLRQLSRIPHDKTVELFKSKDELTFQINKAKIRAKLSAERPSLDMIAQGSAIAVLLREGEKKRKQKPIRTLLEEIGELVQTLKPCFLMSPLSVSTFLSADMKFDVVVFDEASQIFPQDAVGAIYRGKQLIVVGDSKQMPPSNFFNSTSVQEEEDETDDVTDFESILDLCSTTLPQKRLKWHYRSRFEQLIAFSNKHFYENDLITFPSSKKDTAGIGVDYFYVDGVFDRTTKTNRKEAEKIVDLVFEHIKNYPERSLGVVAFSISQQNLIDKLIAKRRRQDSSKEAFFKSDKDDPFFVKNLETVQGDERDTVIFSVAYCKDAQGRLLLNFGPVNREGGERRLNVAVTRAKYNVQLVSSMHYTDIDLTRTQSVGARLLRAYLDFAENGAGALERSVPLNPFERKEAEFETEVCEFLRENGFIVDTQVGCSALKVDLAVKHPDSSDYVLAVECDGATYRSSKNARDRDRLRQEVLERMGWKYYRIWSTDWFRNRRVEKERLLETTRLALENWSEKAKRTQRTKATVEEISFEKAAQAQPFAFPKYALADEKSLAIKCNYHKANVIRAIVELEAPLSEEWLLKRIAFLFGREKVTSVVRDAFNDIMKNCAQYKIIRKNGFLYIQDKPMPMLRVPNENAVLVREVKYIPPQELALGMKELLKQNVSVEKNGLFRLLAKQLGFSRMGDAIFECLEAALRLIDSEIAINGDTLSIK